MNVMRDNELVAPLSVFERLSAAAAARKAMLPFTRHFRRAGARVRPRLNLALQGGGAHGAFTWGVLDSLLGDTSLQFEGLSGSSAGAMNAVVMAHGWMAGHHGQTVAEASQNARDAAREGLARFWGAVGRQLPAFMTTGSGVVADDIKPSTTLRMMNQWASHFSPAQLNPFDLNPLRKILTEQVDFERLRSASPFKLFVGTTEANTGRLRVFRETELTVEMLLASACLPKVHHPVEIGGTAYWDGGYSANPAVFPLFYECDTADVLLVLLSPLERVSTPRSVDEIEARIAEIGFSAHFLREMRTFAEATRYSRAAEPAHGPLERRLNEMRFHMIDSSHLATLASSETKQLAYGPFLDRLRQQGAERGNEWLAEHRSGVGRHSTIDMRRWLN